MANEDRFAALTARLKRPRWIAAAVAAVVILGFLVLVAIDYSRFDQTSGGYDPPYDDWTGTPIDWSEADVTDEGFHRSGIVLDSRLNCVTGMISFRVGKVISFNFREVSPRAIAVHRPREACVKAGFHPDF